VSELLEWCNNNLNTSVCECKWQPEGKCFTHSYADNVDNISSFLQEYLGNLELPQACPLAELLVQFFSDERLTRGFGA
jgi:hypothetical protein